MLSHYEGIISHMQLRKETSTLLIEGCAFGVNLITDRTDTSASDPSMPTRPT
jgi:hypothetical protein